MIKQILNKLINKIPIKSQNWLSREIKYASKSQPIIKHTIFDNEYDQAAFTIQTLLKQNEKLQEQLEIWESIE